MSDLIERDKAIMALRLEYPMMPLFKSLREEWAIKTEGYRKAEEVIMRLPSVDVPTTVTGITDAIREAEYRGYMKAVEDRPKGEWIDKGWKGDWQFETDGRGNCWHEYECSECGFHSKGSKSNFCPNCSADMRGERSGTDKDKFEQ